MLLETIKSLEIKTHDERFDFIAEKLEYLGIKYLVHKYDSGKNIIIPAKNRNFIGISSHYDVVPNAPGANDNASAVAVTLEILNRYLENPFQNFDLQFFFFDEEERGLKGSKAYIETFEINNMLGLLNMEMVGMGDQIALWPSDYNSNIDLLKYAEKFCSENNIAAHRIDRLINSSDHESFRSAGLKNALTISCVSQKDIEVYQEYLIAFSQNTDKETLRTIQRQAPIFEHYHQSTDKSEHLNEKSLQLAANVIWGTLLSFDR